MTLRDLQSQLQAGKGTTRFEQYVIDVAMTSLQTLYNQRITTDNLAWFIIQRLMTDQAAGSFRIQLKSDDNSRYSSNGINPLAGTSANALVRNECLFGTGSLPGILKPNLIIPPGGNILFDIQNLIAGSNTNHLVFTGFLFYPDNT